jgi:phage shock protein C
MSVADEIEKLQRLRDQGALSEEEFTKAKAALLAGEGGRFESGTPKVTNLLDTFRRSKTDRWLGGVCGGLGELTAIPSWAWRLLFTLVALFGGFGVIVYILMWIFVPERRN